jgi:diguanylate cyclase (GGDEF)-like protein
MKESVRPYDTVGRYGGEEFLIVVPETDAGTTLRIADRVRKAVESRVITEKEVDVRVTSSLGVAAGTDLNLFRPQDLLHMADAALYRAKSNGRNRCELATTCTSTDPVPYPSGSRTG